MSPEIILALVIGLAVGAASVFFGIGGGIIIVPVLPLLTPLEPRTVIGTSLLVVLCVAVQNAISFQRRKLIDWKAGSLIGGFAAVGSFIAGRLTSVVSSAVLSLSFASLLLLIGTMTMFRASRGHLPEASSESKKAPLPLIAMFGTLNGFISGFTGVGGGLLVVPVLSMLNWTPQNKVVPTSVATIVFTAGFGTLAFLTDSSSISASWDFKSNMLGQVRLDLAFALFIGAGAMSFILHSKKAALNPRKRDWLVGVLLLALSLRTFIVTL